MVKISKKERDYLVSKGVVCGTNGISKTYNHNTHWFLAETKTNMALLNNYRTSRIVKIYE